MFHHKGTTFIELLVAIFLMSLAILAATYMLLTTIAITKNAHFLTTAIYQIENLKNLLRVYPNEYYPELIKEWNEENKKLLPHGKGDIIVYDSLYKIIVMWGQQKPKCNSQLKYRKCIYQDINLKLFKQSL